MDDLDRKGAVFAVLMLCGFGLALALMVTTAKADASCTRPACAASTPGHLMGQPRFAADIDA